MKDDSQVLEKFNYLTVIFRLMDYINRGVSEDGYSETDEDAITHLGRTIKPYFNEVELGAWNEIYNLKREFKKGDPKYDLAIRERIGKMMELIMNVLHRKGALFKERRKSDYEFDPAGFQVMVDG